MTSFTIAAVQTNSKRDPLDNVREVGAMIREAKARGADLITTPEVVGMVEPKRELRLAKAKPEETHEVLSGFRALSAEIGAWLLIGSISVKVPGEERLANRSFLIDPSGGIVARYDKIHMFDVQVSDQETHRESNAYRPGEEAVLAETPWGPVGLTICYDMRFPYLYRALADAGARVIFVPSAFTRPTGQAHWHVLLRARAIETGCFIVAPAQCGEHAEGRQTYGHSLIVAPWGEVLAEAADDPAILLAEIDLAKVDEARAKVPSLYNGRDYAGPTLYRGGMRAAGD